MENIPVEVVEEMLGEIFETITNDLGDASKIPVHTRLRGLEILSRNALTVQVKRLGDILNDWYMFNKFGDITGK